MGIASQAKAVSKGSALSSEPVKFDKCIISLRGVNEASSFPKGDKHFSKENPYLNKRHQALVRFFNRNRTETRRGWAHNNVHPERGNRVHLPMHLLSLTYFRTGRSPHTSAFVGFGTLRYSAVNDSGLSEDHVRHRSFGDQLPTFTYNLHMKVLRNLKLWYCDNRSLITGASA